MARRGKQLENFIYTKKQLLIIKVLHFGRRRLLNMCAPARLPCCQALSFLVALPLLTARKVRSDPEKVEVSNQSYTISYESSVPWLLF